MTSSSPRAHRSATADWVRAMQRTAPISPSGNRTISIAIDEVVRSFPDRLAFIGESETLTYAGFAKRASLYTVWGHRQGLRQGDTVALMMANTPDYAAIWIGLSRLGVVTALLNTQLVGSGLAHCVRAADPRLVIVDEIHRSKIEGAIREMMPLWVQDAGDGDACALELEDGPLPDLPLVTLTDSALLIYTSGTTGLPKAARVSHYRIMMWSEWFAGIMDATPDDRLYNCLPMYHSIGGVVALGAMLVAGGSVIVRDGFSASRFWPDVVSSQATIFQYIGELCRYLLLASDPDLSQGHRLRLCCGNGLRADVWEQFEQRFEIPRIIEFYAATEGSFSLFNLEGLPGAIGRIPPFMAHRSPVAIVRFDHDEGRPFRGAHGLCVRCENDEPGEAIGRVAASPDALATRFEGYTSESESEKKILRDVFTQGDTWFRTGDLMRRDARGFYFFIDRIGDTFRWKGENVSTAEVSDLLTTCVGVRDATVYGVSVPFNEGRAGMAALVVEDNFCLDQFTRDVESLLPKYARPIFLRLCSQLDTTGTFKVRKADFVDDSFDPSKISDPLFVFLGGRYLPLDRALFERTRTGDLHL